MRSTHGREHRSRVKGGPGLEGRGGRGRRTDLVRRRTRGLLAAGLAQAEAGRVTLVNYTELPGAAVRQLLEWCDLSDRDDMRRTLEQAARFDAKTPSLPFSPSAATIATEAIRAAAGRLTELYERLEARRRARV